MTPLLVAGNEKLNVVMNIDVRAECKGFDAVLTTSDGETQTISYDKDLSGGLKNYRLSFRAFTLESEVVSYKVSIQPRIIGIDPTEVSTRYSMKLKISLTDARLYVLISIK